MAGKPFRVGRFAHTLRVRLMREHLGIDVDSLCEEDLMANDPVQSEYMKNTWDPDTEQAYGKEEGVTRLGKGRDLVSAFLKDALGDSHQGNLLFRISQIVFNALS